MPAGPLREKIESSYLKISRHENKLASKLYSSLNQLKNIEVIGTDFSKRRAPTVSFIHKNKSPNEICKILASYNICAWDGHFYALKAIQDLDLEKIPQIRINNKSDLKGYKDFESRSDIDGRQIWISAERNRGLEELRESISNTLFEGTYRGWISLDASLGNIRSKLYSMGCILEEKISETGSMYALINIGNDELMRFTNIEGFTLIEDTDPFIQ